MKYILLILCLIINGIIYSQDSIYQYEARALTGNIVHIDSLMILYHKNDILKDVPIDFVYGYKRNNKLSILYKEETGPLTAIQMHDYVMGRNLGYKHHVRSFPFAVGFFSSYLYTYRNTRGLTRNPRISSLAFIAVPPLLFTYIRPKGNKKWSYEKQAGYRNARGESNQLTSFWGAVAGTAVMYIFSFAK